MSLSKNRMKYIRSLELKKNRRSEHTFLAEGARLVGDLLGYLPCRFLIATKEWLSAHREPAAEEVIMVSEEELARASLLKSPQQVLAVFEQPRYTFTPAAVAQSLCLALDDVQDPGNLGTIVRLADWFGIEHIFCSPNTADIFNPKAIQATMGGIARVQVHYISLPEFITSLPAGTPVYGTFLDGENIYRQTLTAHGVLIMGNEGNGIGRNTERLIDNRLFIPSYPAERTTSESLNVAIATAVACAEFRRQASLNVKM
ncbi:MAG: RNA methyltransferase [Prevotellaceae bacterium]|jgi:TrmH family RNA methyltransferase|nr:RNA methyltransferase [Prevotellaceae bacterium]